jgi:hypothetical protein
MLFSAVVNAKDLVDVFVTSTSVLGGTMAYASGNAALTSLILGETEEAASTRLNRALGLGFAVGLTLAMIASMISFR